MKQTRYKIVLPKGNVKKLTAEVGKHNTYVRRALQFDSDTAPAQERIRQLAMQKYGGKIVAITKVKETYA